MRMMEQIAAAREELARTLADAKSVDESLQRSGRALDCMRTQVQELRTTVAPLMDKMRRTQVLDRSADAALQPAHRVLAAAQAIRDADSLLSGDPAADPASYVAALDDLDSRMDAIRSTHPRMVEALLAAAESYVAAGTESSSSSLPPSAAARKALQRLQQGLQNLELEPGGFLSSGSDLLLRAADGLAYAVGALVQRGGRVVDLRRADEEHLADTMNAEVLDMIRRVAGRLQAEQCLKTFRSARIKCLRDCFRTMNPLYLQFKSAAQIDELEWQELEDYVADWVFVLRKTARVLLAPERRLCEELFGDFGEERWTECFGKLALGSGLAALLAFGHAVAASSREPQKLFKLLDMLEGLQLLEPEMESLFCGASCAECVVRIHDLRENLSQSCVEVLEEVCKHVEHDSGLPADGSVPKLTSYVLNYLLFMVSEYGELMQQVLNSRKKYDLSEATAKVFGALESSLENRAKRYNSSGLAHLFLMNNYWYLFKRCRDSKLGEVLGEQWLKQRKRLVNQHVLAYQKEVWGSLLTNLSTEGLSSGSTGKGGSKDLFKQRLRAFYSAFDRTYATHKNWVITDDEFRDGTFVKISQLMISAYRNYTGNYGHLLDQQGNEAKLIRYTPEELEDVLFKLFTKNTSEAAG